MLDKIFDDKFIDIAYDEVRDAMRHIINTTDALDKKTHSVLTICIAVLFAICGFLFVKSNILISHIISCIVMILGTSAAIFFLYEAYKVREYYIFGEGSNIDDILDEDSYYHDAKGFKIYLIERYKNKIDANTKNNNYKAQHINKSMLVLLYSGVVAFLIFIAPATIIPLAGEIARVILSPCQ